MAHYIGLMQSHYEQDDYPHVICIKTNYRAQLQEDSLLDPADRKFGTFNRHYMEYSMYCFDDRKVELFATEDYDHFKIRLDGRTAKTTFLASLAEPAYYDYTSPVTKSHIIGNPHLATEILQSHDWTKFVRDYDEHFAQTLGPMRNYINGDAMSFHYRRNQMFPYEPESRRINKEIRDWFDMEALRGNTWSSSYLDDTTPGTDDALQQNPTTEPQEGSQSGDYMADDLVERGRTGDTTSQGSSSGSSTTKMNTRRAAQLLRRMTVIKGHTKAASVKHMKAKL